MSQAVMNRLTPEGLEQLRQADLPIPLAMDLLQMWYLSDERRFRKLNATILVGLMKDLDLLFKAFLEARVRYQEMSWTVADYEIMQAVGIPLTLRDALGTSR